MSNRNLLIVVFYSILSLLLTSYILGIDNLSFISTKWLTAHDVTSDIVSWKFFKNDIWRFPLGSNPTYGMDIGSGIAFSGSIPILAIIFKLFAGVLPDNFHYFNLWIFICFFLQSYIAFLIIYNKSNNLLFSIVGSLFFLLSPVLINRLSFHLALSAHWLILMSYYLETKKDLLHKNIYWTALISLSSLIHLYFTIILLGIFFLFSFNDLKEKINLKKFLKETTQVIGFLVFTMFVIGYFHVPFTDALAYGYGDYALDIGGIFVGNTSVPSGEISWSFFFQKTQPLSQEGFAYLGMGGIFFLIFLIIIFTFNYRLFIKKKSFLPFFLIILIFSIIAISNKIHLFGNHLLSLEIPTIFYGLLSVVRASGRLFWPVYYLIFLIPIIFLYKKFSKKKSIYILMLIFSFQLIDLYPGIRKNFNAGAFPPERKMVNYSFWNDLTKKYSSLRTTYLSNESKFLLSLREILLLKNIKNTDISTHGRYNRKLASISRSNLYKSFDQKIIPNNIIFAIDNYNHLRNFKYLFEDKDVGFFLKDKVWLAVDGYKDKMSNYDKNELEQYNPIILKPYSKINLEFHNENSIHGFGWTHNNPYSNNGLWTEGNISNLLFKLNEINNDNFKIKIRINSIITKNNEPINFTIEINDNFSKRFSLKNINELKENSIFIDTDKILLKDKIVYIKFIIDNPVTKLELLESPDARKLGLLVESIELINN
jgi:hypothetical protein